MSRTLLLIAAALIAIGLFGWWRGPYATALPMDLAELPALEPKLAKLEPEERELVLGYLKRSNGDVLPPAMADPDDPFTARTFGEAIALQRAFLAKKKVWDEEARVRQAQREAAMAPLRAVLEIRLLDRRIMTRNQAMGIEPLATPDASKSANPRNEILVSTYRLINRSGRAIAASSGSVVIRDSKGERLSDCWIDRDEPLPAGESAEIRCSFFNRDASAADRAYAAMPASALQLSWEPRTVRFADGSELKSGL